MYHIPDKDSIRKQLRELGYSNVPDEVLSEFVADLEKLYQQQSPKDTPSHRERYQPPPTEFYTPHHNNINRTHSSNSKSLSDNSTKYSTSVDEDAYTPPAIYMKSSQKSKKSTNNSIPPSPANIPYNTNYQANFVPSNLSQPNDKYRQPTNSYDEEVDYADYRGDMYEYYPTAGQYVTSSEDDITYAHPKTGQVNATSKVGLPQRPPTTQYTYKQQPNVRPQTAYTHKQEPNTASFRPQTAPYEYKQQPSASHHDHNQIPSDIYYTSSSPSGEEEEEDGDMYSDQYSDDSAQYSYPDHGYVGGKPNSIGVIWTRQHTTKPRKSDPVSRYREMQNIWARDTFLNSQKKNKNTKLYIPFEPPFQAPRKDLGAMRPSYVVPSEKRRDNLRFQVRAKMA